MVETRGVLRSRDPCLKQGNATRREPVPDRYGGVLPIDLHANARQINYSAGEALEVLLLSQCLLRCLFAGVNLQRPASQMTCFGAGEMNWAQGAVAVAISGEG